MRMKRHGLHAVRMLLVTLVVTLIHLQHRDLVDRKTGSPVDIGHVRTLFPEAAAVGTADSQGIQAVEDASGHLLGTVLQTSPQCDHIIGFSGPTRLIIGLSSDGRLAGIRIASSNDTRDHVRQVEKDERFFAAFVGRTPEELEAEAAAIDAVSGATLTSMAIVETVVRRLNGRQPSLRFPKALTAADARRLFPEATRLEPDDPPSERIRVFDDRNRLLGTILRTAGVSDSIIGYQGPADCLIGLDADDRVIGMVIRHSYDNQPYVRWVQEDDVFRKLFLGRTSAELAAWARPLGREAAVGTPSSDTEPDEIPEWGVLEGVSGATMTSTAIIRAIVAAARDDQEKTASPSDAVSDGRGSVNASIRDAGTAAVTVVGLLIGLTSLRTRRGVRLLWQAVLIGYLGLINGDLLSQALLAGWAQSGIPWRSAFGLVCLTAAAVLVPLFGGRNIYCHHLCPHGAVQRLVRGRLPWQVRVTGRGRRLLRLLPLSLLIVVVVVAMIDPDRVKPFSLVDIEPFDAWVVQVAGGATIGVAVAGIAASLLTPMAYCRWGCPTGALLQFLQRSGRSDRLTGQDMAAALLLLLAVLLWVQN